MNIKKASLILFPFFLATSLNHCLKSTKSKKNALESDDLFRNKKDRFYLATIKSAVPMEGSQTSFVGDDMLVGIGCYSEAKDPATVVEVKKSKCSTESEPLALNQRRYLHQFPIIGNSENPKPGQCKVILGNLDFVQTMENLPREFAYGPAANLKNSVYSALGWCGVSVAFMVLTGPAGGTIMKVAKGATIPANTTSTAIVLYNQPVNQNILSRMGTALTHTTMSQLLSGAGKTLGKINPLTMIPKTAGTIGTGGVNMVSAITGATSSGIKMLKAAPVSQVLMGGLTLLPCGGVPSSFMAASADSQKVKNRNALFKGLAKAEELARAKIKSGPNAQAFQTSILNHDFSTTAALLYPQMAMEFNTNVVEFFENGWGFDRNNNKFFDMVSIFAEELKNDTVVDTAPPGNPAPPNGQPPTGTSTPGGQ